MNLFNYCEIRWFQALTRRRGHPLQNCQGQYFRPIPRPLGGNWTKKPAKRLSMANADPNKNHKEEKKHIKYNLQTHFDDLNIPKFLSISATAYVIECVFYHPFEVLRTRLQVNREVRNYMFSSLAIFFQLDQRDHQKDWTSW